jgi:hypothetical protein
VRSLEQEANRVPTATERFRSARIPANTWSDCLWVDELGIFCAVADDGDAERVMASADGETWSRHAAPAANAWTSLAWAPELGLLCAVASTGSGNRVMTSTDGRTWTLRSTASPDQDRAWRSVCWSPERRLFVAVSTDGGTTDRVMTSPDGFAWTSRPTPEWITLAGAASVTWSPKLSLFAAVASSSANGILVSTDGISWEQRSLSPARNPNFPFYRVRWVPQLSSFVTVGGYGDNFPRNSGAAATTATGSAVSTDGATWTYVPIAPRGAVPRDFVWVDGAERLCAVCRIMTDGVLATGIAGTSLLPDPNPVFRGEQVLLAGSGLDWKMQRVPQSRDYRTVAWSRRLGRLVILGTEGPAHSALISP